MSSVLLNPQYRLIFALIKGARNGIVYGCKIRFPHALVMTFLFKEGSLSDKLPTILEATYTHAKNLALFVFIYRLARYLCQLLPGCEVKKNVFSVFSSAALAGYLVFGADNRINEQVNLYLLSRITYGFAHLLYAKFCARCAETHANGMSEQSIRSFLTGGRRVFFPLFAALMWGCVLSLFEFEPQCLQASLQSSMTYLYQDSQRWSCWRDLLWVNRLPDARDRSQ